MNKLIKIMATAGACFTIFATSAQAFAEYNPYTLNCTYDASNDGFIKMKTGKMDADSHDFPVSLSKVSNGEQFNLEFKEVFIIGNDDLSKLPQEHRQGREALLQRLGIDESRVFTTTRFVLFDGTPTMVVWKFNSTSESLGIGIQAKNWPDDPNSLAVCN